MFLIKSYIKYPGKNIYSLNTIQKNPFAYFIDIKNVAELQKIKKQLDADYVDGVLYLAYNNKIIMDFSMWDLIDQLWSYLLNMIEELLQNKKASVYFPDQPILMTMEDTADQYIIFSIKIDTTSTWRLPKYQFLEALLSAAKDFFCIMTTILKNNSTYYEQELKRIKLLEQKIGALKFENKLN